MVPAQPVLLTPCVGVSFPGSDAMRAPLFCLSICVHHATRGQPHCCICPLQGGDGAFHSVTQEEFLQAQGPPLAAGRHPLAVGSCPVPSLYKQSPCSIQHLTTWYFLGDSKTGTLRAGVLGLLLW